MARIPLVDSNDDDADPKARELLKLISGARIAQGGIEPNVYRAIANHPQALESMVQFGTVVYLANSTTPAQRELAYLTASVVNNCHY